MDTPNSVLRCAGAWFAKRICAALASLSFALLGAPSATAQSVTALSNGSAAAPYVVGADSVLLSMDPESSAFEEALKQRLDARRTQLSAEDFQIVLGAIRQRRRALNPTIVDPSKPFELENPFAAPADTGAEAVLRRLQARGVVFDWWSGIEPEPKRVSWIDRITQVAPGAGPIVAPGAPPTVDEPDRILYAQRTGPNPDDIADTPCNAALGAFWRYHEAPALPPGPARRAAAQLNRACYGAGEPIQARFEPLMARMVVIRAPDDRYSNGHCTGFLLTDSIVLTAAHCLDARPNEATLTTVKMDDRPCTQFSVETIEHQIISVTGLVSQTPVMQGAPCPFAEFPRSDLAQDMVLLRLAAPALDGAHVRLRPYARAHGEISLRERPGLFIIGRNPTGYDPSSPGGPFLIERTNGCRLFYDPATVKGALIHQCLTLPGMSGAPIFAETDRDELQLVGVHQSSLVTEGRCVAALTPDPCTSGMAARQFLNIGHGLMLSLPSGDTL